MNARMIGSGSNTDVQAGGAKAATRPINKVFK
jgi:hypothetical protein